MRGRWREKSSSGDGVGVRGSGGEREEVTSRVGRVTRGEGQGKSEGLAV